MNTGSLYRALRAAAIALGSMALGCSGGEGGGAGGDGAGGDGGDGAHAVINEISAKGGDWIEIANPTSRDLDLGGFGLCDDVDPTAGSACDLTTVVRLPAGTTLPAKGYLLVLGDQDTSAGAGPYTTCLESGGPDTCYYATWKVSSSNGEAVHLIDTADAAVDEVHYPANAAPDGKTWGRLPDGTGAFAVNAPTPGAANKAP